MSVQPAGSPNADAGAVDPVVVDLVDVDPVDPEDLEAASRQLGRAVRGVVEVAHRCPCGEPDVLRTRPRLPDGTPFPTTYYVTCPRLTGALSTLESEGLMRSMQNRLADDEQLAAAYSAAHEDYLCRRGQLGTVPEIDGISAGGMPTRVKCLHVLVGHALAAGPGVNPFGDEALAELAARGQWWHGRTCADDAAGAEMASAADEAADEATDEATDAATGTKAGTQTSTETSAETGAAPHTHPRPSEGSA